ncbi:MAG: hypothetical protein ACREM1_09675, partial [Longimicrobiales bacterium]
VQVFDARFDPVADAVVHVRIAGPDGRSRALRAVPANASAGVYRTSFIPATSGTYDIRVSAERESSRETTGPAETDQPTIRRARATVQTDVPDGAFSARLDDGGGSAQLDDGDGSARLGEARAWLLVGGADPEMADPRRNDAALERLAEATGGRLLDADAVARLPELIAASSSSPVVWVQRELWHTPWTFLLVAVLLCTEWALRRRWGLR